MPNGKPEAHEALDDFRNALIEIFSDLRARIDSLEDVALHGDARLTEAKLKKIYKSRSNPKLREYYAAKLPSPYDSRR